MWLLSSTMQLRSFLQHLLTGSYALFGAQRSGHTAVCLRAMLDEEYIPLQRLQQHTALHPGQTCTTWYHCAKLMPARVYSSMNEWEHRQRVHALSRSKLEVEDTLTWPRCTAQRRYTVTRASLGAHKRHSCSAWEVTLRGRGAPPRAALQYRLQQVDSAVFHEFMVQQQAERDADSKLLLESMPPDW